jgi:hypothetical protein
MRTTRVRTRPRRCTSTSTPRRTKRKAKTLREPLREGEVLRRIIARDLDSLLDVRASSMRIVLRSHSSS